MRTGVFKGCCSDTTTLPISNWLFHLKGGTIPPYCALQFLPFISIGVNRLCIYIVFAYAYTNALVNAFNRVAICTVHTGHVLARILILPKSSKVV